MKRPQFLPQLPEGKRSINGWMSRCPTHENQGVVIDFGDGGAAGTNVVVLPHDSDAEAGALACILIASRNDGERMLAELAEADFYELKHKKIFLLLQSLHSDGKPLIIPELHYVARANGQVENCGGFDYLQRLPEVSPSPENFLTFKRIVKDYAVRRGMVTEADALRERALDISSPAIANSSSLPGLIDAASLLDMDLPEPPQLIDGILHKGCKLVLGGGSKSYKTWTLLDLALSVACGLPWLNFKTQAAPVCFVNFELQQWTIKERIQALVEAKGITSGLDKLKLLNLRGRADHYNNVLPQIRERIGSSESDIGLIILDPIYKLYAAGGKENDTGDIAQLLNAIESLAVETESAVAFGSHFSKGNQAGKESIDRISGSGVFARDPDSILTLTQHKMNDCFVVEPTLRALKPVAPFVVRWEYPLMRPDASLNHADLKRTAGRKPKHKAKEILAAIIANDENDPISISDWAKRLSIPRTSLNDYLPEMRQKGWIKMIGAGVTAKQAITIKGKSYLDE